MLTRARNGGRPRGRPPFRHPSRSVGDRL